MMAGVERCCGAICPFGSVEHPCWGNVHVVDEDWVGGEHYWIHACEGHAEVSQGGKYQQPPTECSTVRVSDVTDGAEIMTTE